MSILGTLAFGAVAVAAVGAAMAFASSEADRKQKRAQGIASRLGLTLRGTDELVGRYGGFDVVQYSKDRGGSSSTDWWTITRVRLAEATPDGLRVQHQGFFGGLASAVGLGDLQLGNALDSKLWITAVDQDGARSLLTDDEVVRAFQQALAPGSVKVDLIGPELELEVRGHHLDQAAARLNDAVGIARALADAGKAPWEALAQVYDLNIDADQRRIDGEVDGIRVSVVLKERPTTRTVISATLPTPLPEGTFVMAGEDGERLGDPILDGRIAARGTDVGALRQRLVRDDVRGPLLEVLHGHPQSVLTATAVELVEPGRLGSGLADAFDAAVALAAALR